MMRRSRLRADRRLRRFAEHDSRCRQNRVGHIARFGACGAWILDHRFEHLRGRDHRPTHPIGERDDLLLCDRHFFEGELDAQIAARHHHRVGGLHDLFDVLERHVLLDFRDHENRLGLSLRSD
jgi:hypothetical protein